MQKIKSCFNRFSTLNVLSNDEQYLSIWGSVASASTEHFNFTEPEHVLEHLTLEHRTRALSTWFKH
jgi:hypothetical protein